MLGLGLVIYGPRKSCTSSQHCNHVSSSYAQILKDSEKSRSWSSSQLQGRLTDGEHATYRIDAAREVRELIAASVQLLSSTCIPIAVQLYLCSGAVVTVPPITALIAGYGDLGIPTRFFWRSDNFHLPIAYDRLTACYIVVTSFRPQTT